MDEFPDEIDFKDEEEASAAAAAATASAERGFFDELFDAVLEKTPIPELKESLKREKRDLEAAVKAKFRQSVQSLVARRARIEAKVQEPAFLLMQDKLTFTASVLVLLLTQHIVLRHPDLMASLYSIVVTLLLAIRFQMYHKSKWHYFLIDFCYFAQAVCLYYLYVDPGNKRLFVALFTLSNGPLAWGIAIWRNSFVFHDVDKVTSCFIHIYPPILCFCLRWYPSAFGPDSVSLMDGLVIPMVLYAFWQLSYYLKTEVVDREKLEADDEIQTSVKWLVGSEGHPVSRLLDRWHCPPRFYTLSFMAMQFVYTALTMLPVPFLLYPYHNVNGGFLILMICLATWNGAQYYFEKFSIHLSQKYPGYHSRVPIRRTKRSAAAQENEE